MESGSHTFVTAEDRREALRQAPSASAVLIQSGEDDIQWGEILDVSRTGMRLRTSQSCEVDSVVTLGSPLGMKLPTCTARIVRQIDCPSNGEPRFAYGLLFVDMAAEDRHAWFLGLRARNAA